MSSTFSISIAVESSELEDKRFDAAAIFKLRDEMRAVFGWKEDYGKLTTSSDASERRTAAELQADIFIRNCSRIFGGDSEKFGQAMSEFHRLKVDFGWKNAYGKLSSTSSAIAKRAEAERKAANAVFKMF